MSSLCKCTMKWHSRWPYDNRGWLFSNQFIIPKANSVPVEQSSIPPSPSPALGSLSHIFFFLGLFLFPQTVFSIFSGSALREALTRYNTMSMSTYDQ